MDTRKAQMINEYNRKKAAGHEEEVPEVLLNSHLSENFKDYVLNNYNVKDKSVLESDEVK